MDYFPAFIAFVCGEIVGLLYFPLLTRTLGPKGASAWNLLAISKGALERLVLFTALLHDYPQIIIAFAAMKLGTRLHHEKDSDISNNYFLLGNLMSIFIALITAIITKKIWAA